MSFFGATATTTNTSTAAEKDVEVVDPPADGISSLSFSSQADYLAVGSWDNSVCTETILCKVEYLIYHSRSESMKLVRMDKHRERQCTNIKDPFWTFAGTRYVVPFSFFLHAQYHPIVIFTVVVFRKVIKSSQAVQTMQAECLMWLLVRQRK